MTNRSKKVILQLMNEKHQAEVRVQELEGRHQEFEARNDELLELICIYEKEAKEMDNFDIETKFDKMQLYERDSDNSSLDGIISL